MNRKNFITLLSGGIAMASIQPFYDWTKDNAEFGDFENNPGTEIDPL